MDYSGKTVTVKLDAQNKSGESGTATITDDNGKAKVVVNITGEAATANQPAHIHTGSCPTPGDVKYALTTVSKGKSETTLTLSVNELMAQLPLAINIHKSAGDLKTYVVCGNVMAPAAQ